ncbi:MAG TPA: cytochrome c, partial [Pirellulaceae bacterium]
QWTMNCFACHGGRVLGQPYPGAPNADFELETLTEEIRQTKLLLGKPFSRMDVGALVMPLGTTRGTTNAVMFGVSLMAFRDADLNVRPHRPHPRMTHHDMDAPPWWHFGRKASIYIDGFAQKNVRGLMQFMLVREYGPEKFREWEPDFRDVYAYLESLRAPKYPFLIDDGLADQGRELFERTCAECHGTYGETPSYPERRVPLAELGTDPIRLTALTPRHRRSYHASWFANYGAEAIVEDPDGYVAPPLDGIWASAPYLHNGSVPTLWHLLHPRERPEVWRRLGSAYDRQQLGLVVESVETDRPGAHGVTSSLSRRDRRRIFDTRVPGKSAAGHDFPDALSDDEKRAVLEYLKRL